MDYIKQLVSKDNLEQALNELELIVTGAHENEVTLIQARLSSLEKEIRSNTIRSDEVAVSKGKIVKAILSIADHYPSSSSHTVVENPDVRVDSTQNILMNIIKEHKDLNPSLAIEAEQLLQNFNEYTTELAKSDFYDPNGEVHDVLIEMVKDLQSKLKEQAKEDKSDILATVSLKFDNPLTWVGIKAAYYFAKEMEMPHDDTIQHLIDNQSTNKFALVSSKQKIVGYFKRKYNA